MPKLNDEQLAGIAARKEHLPIVADLLETIAGLKRQVAERDRIAYPIIGIPSAKDFARQCDPFEPDSETTTGTCAHWRDKVEKVFAQVRSIFDAYVQEKADDARIDEHTAYCNLCILKRECLRLYELRNRAKVKP